MTGVRVIQTFQKTSNTLLERFLHHDKPQTRVIETMKKSAVSQLMF